MRYPMIKCFLIVAGAFYCEELPAATTTGTATATVVKAPEVKDCKKEQDSEYYTCGQLRCKIVKGGLVCHVM
jgi:hypothetical protein